MKFIFVTLFKDLIKPYFENSILKKAIDKNLISIDFFNPRNFSNDKHSKVDNSLAGGGAGMLMSPQPLYDTLKHIKNIDKNSHIIFLLPAGKTFHQNDAKRLSRINKNIVLVSGRYEGLDERVVEEFADEIFSIGNYILTGGELPSLVLVDSISRNINGVLGNSQSLDGESFENLLLEAPNFTKPNTFNGNSITSELLKGNHGKIATLKTEFSILKTKYYKPNNKIKYDIRKKYDK